MNDTFQYTSAGRTNNESKDCTVRSLTVACDLPYNQVHNALAHRGRRNCHGVNLNMILHTRFLKHKLEVVKRNGSLQKFIQEFPTGRFVVVVRRHAFAVVDGVVHDMTRQSLRRHVICAWRVTKILPAITEESQLQLASRLSKFGLRFLVDPSILPI